MQEDEPVIAEPQARKEKAELNKYTRIAIEEDSDSEPEQEASKPSQPPQAAPPQKAEKTQKASQNVEEQKSFKNSTNNSDTKPSGRQEDLAIFSEAEASELVLTQTKDLASEAEISSAFTEYETLKSEANSEHKRGQFENAIQKYKQCVLHIQNQKEANDKKNKSIIPLQEFVKREMILCNNIAASYNHLQEDQNVDIFL